MHNHQQAELQLNLRKKFSLFLSVAGVVAALSVVKLGIHWLGFEFIALNALLTSGIAGAIFIIGFLLSSVLADYKEAERIPAELRVALEAIHGDVVNFSPADSTNDKESCRNILVEIVSALRAGLSHEQGHSNLGPALGAVDKLSALFGRLEKLGCPPNYVVRLRTSQDTLRRGILRIYHIQRVQFVPSVHVLVQALVAAIIILLLFLKTEGSPESALLFGFIAFLFVYALYLINLLEKPFLKGHSTFDDVSPFFTDGIP